jgi:hypothetical protein
MENIYTHKYIELQNAFDQANEQFDNKPNAKTAKQLSDLRVKINNLPNDQKFTKEYLDQRAKDRKIQMHKDASYMRNLVTTISIESAYKKGDISNSMRNAHHEINDIANPINR